VGITPVSSCLRLKLCNNVDSIGTRWVSVVRLNTRYGAWVIAMLNTRYVRGRRPGSLR